jgi:hypothetical protein
LAEAMAKGGEAESHVVDFGLCVCGRLFFAAKEHHGNI